MGKTKTKTTEWTPPSIRVDKDTRVSEAVTDAAQAVASIESDRIPARKVGVRINERERALERHKAQREDHLRRMNEVRRSQSLPDVQPTTADEWREYIG